MVTPVSSHSKIAPKKMQLLRENKQFLLEVRCSNRVDSISIGGLDGTGSSE